MDKSKLYTPLGDNAAGASTLLADYWEVRSYLLAFRPTHDLIALLGPYVSSMTFLVCERRVIFAVACPDVHTWDILEDKLAEYEQKVLDAQERAKWVTFAKP